MMYSYDDHTPPVWSDPNQSLIMQLPSSTNQRTTPHHMHISSDQSDPSAWSTVILDQSEARHKY